jgi:hypothetical protein
MKQAILRRFYPLNFPLKANFRFRTSRVYTITKKEFKEYENRKRHPEEEPYEDEIRKNSLGCLVIESISMLKPYDALYEMAADLRPQLLIIYGILSFLTDEVFDPTQCFNNESFVTGEDVVLDTPKPLLSKEGENYSKDLEKILDLIEESKKDKQILLYSLFERWRKALFLMKESDGNWIHVDEAVLAYIHIFEVLSDEFKKQLKTEVKENRERLINAIIARANGDDNKKYEDIDKLITEASDNRVTLKPKVMCMLKEMNLLNPKTEAIIVRFIEHRNAIAHGRKDLYQDKVVFPLKPFFSFIKDTNENIEIIKVFAARVISQYIGLKRWEPEWRWALVIAPPPFNLVKEFIFKKSYQNITEADIIDGVFDGVDPRSLYIYYIKNKISFDDLENALAKVITSSTLKKEECQALFNVAVILADSKSIDVANTAREIVRKSHTKQWYFYSNIRDALKEVEYYNKTLFWFPEWLIEKK